MLNLVGLFISLSLQDDGLFSFLGFKLRKEEGREKEINLIPGEIQGSTFYTLRYLLTASLKYCALFYANRENISMLPFVHSGEYSGFDLHPFLANTVTEQLLDL